uniref:SAP domain-containing protein n=1 Tax=viral metagenome TaxID=1070528 RepID=A0A6C0I3T5_9ZZZZ
MLTNELIDVSLSNILQNSPAIALTKRKQVSKKKKEEDVVDGQNIKGQAISNELKKLKIPELKALAKQNKLHVSGSKPVLLERIQTYFRRTDQAKIIQKWFRRHMVVQSHRLRGPAVKNRKMCTNETDYATMEPIEEIAYEQFFSYTDSKSFTYGFNIASLIQSIKPKGSSYYLVNPYNREVVDPKVMLRLISLYKICFIIYPEFATENPRTERFQQAIINRHVSRSQPATLFTDGYNPVVNELYLQVPENRERYSRLQAIREKPVEQRVQDLFMEIDQLGNYTQSVWFSNLERMEYIRLYRILYDIWHFRGQLSYTVRNNICPFHDPFSTIFNRPMYHNNINIETIKKACLLVFETMVYSAADDDNRRLGAFHALSALTLVSSGARNALPWLYESIA